MRRRPNSFVWIIAALLVATPHPAPAQYRGPSSICLPNLEQGDREPPPDKPRTIDPTRFLPAPLTKRLTFDVVDQEFVDAVDEFSRQIDMTVVLDRGMLEDDGISADEQVTIRMKDDPAYLFLERLDSLDLEWFVRDDVVHITKSTVAYETQTTRIRVIADLLQAGFRQQGLHDTLAGWLDIDWDLAGGLQEPFIMNEKLLVTRCSDEEHRKIDALLAALREHGTQTYVLEPTENVRIRAKLRQPVDVKFVDTRLKRFVSMTSEQTGIPIQLDEWALQDVGISLDEPITLILKDKPVATVLELAVESPLDLEAIPMHGLLLITTAEYAEEITRTAVFGVGDLCRNECESNDLIEMIMTQTGGKWINGEGTGGTVFAPRHDVLVIRNTDRSLFEIRRLLDVYRSELAENPPPETDYTEIETRHYTVTAKQAADLLATIPELIEPGTWKRVANPEAPRIETLAEDGIGSLLRVAAEPDVEMLHAPVIREPGDDEQTTDERPVAERTLITPRAMLIIRHTKLTQLKIAQLMERLPQSSYTQPTGGGFFQVGPEDARRN